MLYNKKSIFFLNTTENNKILSIIFFRRKTEYKKYTYMSIFLIKYEI